MFTEKLTETPKRRMVIRPRMFETNSSSMHAIAVRKTYVPPTVEQREKRVAPYMDDDGVINLDKYMPEYYDWGYDVLCTFIDKLCYVVSALRVTERIDRADEYKCLLEAIGVPRLTEISLRGDTASIDHQSIGMLQETLPDFFHTVDDNDEWIESMRRLLFDPECFIVIDNDNNDSYLEGFDRLEAI